MERPIPPKGFPRRNIKVSKLHPELKQYLKDNNNYGMKIE